jgi:hypothetical protein
MEAGGRVSRRAALVAAAAVACAAEPVAAASDATSAQVAALAARAASDPQALAELRAIDHVDGQPVDLAAALDAQDEKLAERLRVLAASAGTKSGALGTRDPSAAAKTILEERRFRGSDVPRPLHSPLRWLGRELRRISDAIARPLPGGGRTLELILAAAVAAAAAFVATRLARRRAARQLADGGAGSPRVKGEDPRRLEREADQAERDGAFERALRLRFRAGLLRLARAKAIPEQTTLTNGEIARELRSSSFRALVTDFDQVVYGRRAAGIGEVERAREGWPRVVQEAGRR